MHLPNMTREPFVRLFVLFFLRPGEKPSPGAQKVSRTEWPAEKIDSLWRDTLKSEDKSDWSRLISLQFPSWNQKEPLLDSPGSVFSEPWKRLLG